VENSVTFDPSLDYGATFRFPVTWSYVSGAPNQKVAPAQANPSPAQSIPRSAKPMPVPVPLETAPPAPKPVEPVAPKPVAATMDVATTKSNQALSHQALKPAGPAPSGPDAKWEMVIPKMARPATAARPQRSFERAAQPPPGPPSPAPVTVDETPTKISFYAGSEASFVPRRWKTLSLCAAAVVVGCVIAWVRPSSNSASVADVTDSAPAAPGMWSRRMAYVVGGKVPREILIYSGSEDVKNYRIEFSWVPDTRGVGWIFRGTDSANYYAANLRLIQSGARPSLSAEHFAVVKGVEGTHARKVITLDRALGQVQVRMDANGPAFTLYLQGNPTDYWTDERFETGSLGFYAERGERPMLQALRFTFFRKSGLQTVVTSLQ
jgi:hypothetical protein